FNDVAGFIDGVANPASLGIKFSQPGIQELRRRVGLNGQPVFLNGLGGVFRAAIHGHHLFIHVRQAIVIVGGSTVRLLSCRRLRARDLSPNRGSALLLRSRSRRIALLLRSSNRRIALLLRSSSRRVTLLLVWSRRRSLLSEQRGRRQDQP